MNEVLTAALTWHDQGYCVLPTRTDGSKAPDVTTWKAYQNEAPNRQRVEAWFADDHPGVGVLCGAISGNLEMLELEGRAVTEGALADLQHLIEQSGLADLWLRITRDGYTERTPSGGLHFLYRVDGTPVPGNTKLANRPATDAELEAKPKETVKGLAETRGEGGYVVVAPSHGPTHPSGKPWELVHGGPGQVATITADEREQLHRLFRCLDKIPVVEPAPARPLQVVRGTTDGATPGDDFEAKVPWDDPMLLGGAGWRPTFSQGHVTFWRRPGKDTPGVSATTGKDPARDRLYVFSSATEFPTETPITKFGAYALLHHANDFKAAARELRRLGYGAPLPSPSEQQRAAIADLVPDVAERTMSSVDGNTVRVLAEPKAKPQFFGATQDGMARALVEHHGHELRYVPQRGKWLAWDGHRWQWDDNERHRELTLGLARHLPEDDKDWKLFRRSMLSSAGVTGATRLAQSNAKIVVGFDKLDADPWVLNTPGGIIDLRTGELSPPDPAALCTRSTSCAPDTDADPRRWQEFLADTFGADQALVGYLQRLLGYSAVGVVGAHVLPFAHGSGGNGKGVFLEALAGVLGEYATSAPNGFLMQQPFPGHDTEIARLAGARMVICSEVNEDDRFDEAKVKMLTGGDTLTARFMRQDYFTFQPTHQLWLMGNHQPAVRSGGRSFWRRLRLIPFDHEVPEDKIEDDLQGKLIRDHGPALLAWIAAGAAAYHRGGLGEPDSVKAATAEYAHDQDSVARFVEECCRVGGGAHVTTKVAKVREAYEAWCQTEGAKPVTAKRLTMDLDRKFGVTGHRTKAARMYSNITVLADGNLSPDSSNLSPDSSNLSPGREEQGGW
jgi:putative DNA primase/helicase